MRVLHYILPLCVAAVETIAAEPPAEFKPFLQNHCYHCHDADDAKGGLDLSALSLDLTNPKVQATWVTVHDRIRDGEMPPKKRKQPDAAELKAFLKSVAEPLVAADQKKEASEGRSTLRRLNRLEYENAMRDLLGAPWLQIKEILPEDGESHRFNKIGDALDVSHVQMAQYLEAAEYALRQVLALEATKPAVKRYYAREQQNFTKKMFFNEFNRSPERATFPTMGFDPQPDVRSGKAPMTVGEKDPKARDLEGIGLVASSYEPLEPKFDSFKAPQAGRYKLRICGHTAWVGPGEEKKYWRPDFDKVEKGRREEPITIYGEVPPRIVRRLGSFDLTPDPVVREVEVVLIKGEMIRPDASRFFRSRPPNWHNPLAQKDGTPGVVYRWMEVEGPLVDEGTPAGQRLLFGDLPLKRKNETTVAESANPAADAERLLRAFLKKAYRRPVKDEDVKRFMTIADLALKSKASFTEAMIATYSAVLCSPTFVCLEEVPGKLDDAALAARLSLFLTNSVPDDELRSLAEHGKLRDPQVLRAQTERLLNAPTSKRFVDAFLDYWLDLRKMNGSSPDAALYPDYYLDDLLAESADIETRMYFTELLRENRPAREIVSSDFTYVNERLAQHYGLPVAEKSILLKRVKLPDDSPRGGIMTQASVLKVTANGTTTSPVLRGAWIMERIVGKPPPPPPPSVPAVEPDIRGATTIREQLDKHRSVESCAACHTKIDPPGFALESFDVLGGWRGKYRALGEGKKPLGWGKNGQPFDWHDGPAIDASGEMPKLGAFKDIVEFKKVLLKDERQIARNLASQFVVYATGAPIRFGDRARVEAILDKAAASNYGVKTLVHEIVQSDLFQTK